jgi:hypothetical protein
MTRALPSPSIVRGEDDRDVVLAVDVERAAERVAILEQYLARGNRGDALNGSSRIGAMQWR